MFDSPPDHPGRGRRLVAPLRGLPRPGLLVVLAALIAALAGCATGTTRSAAAAAPSRAAAAAPAVPCPSSPAAAAASAPPSPAVSARAGTTVLIRVNQLGYVAGCPAEASVMATHRPPGERFSVLDARSGSVVLRGRLGRSHGAFNRRWRVVYRIDLSRLTRIGAYLLQVAGARPQPLRVAAGSTIYGPLTRDVTSFFSAQRDGPDVIPGPLHRQPSHLLDAHAAVYAIPSYRGTTLLGHLTPTATQIDASGGWFDAGDYLKFVETASFDDAMMLFTLRQYRAGLTDPAALTAEARFGTDWLLKMWDQSRRVLYYQVGIGDGNGSSILGDHDLWRLPQADDHRAVHPGSPAYYETYRPVFAANSPGAQISPNLAGRVAADFALCAQVFAVTDPAYAHQCLLDGQTIYDLANTHWRGPLLTTSPHAYYDEPEWRDDMELGAAELYLATRQLGGQGLPHPSPFYYAGQAGFWADAYINSPASQGGVSADSLNLYDVSSVADFDLIRILRSQAYNDFQKLPNNGVDVPTDPTTLMRDRHDQLMLATHLAGQDPFGLANPATNVDTVPHALGYAAQARMYDDLAGRPVFAALAHSQLAWVFGANAWGSSFIVGEGHVFPHCLAAQIPNLSGSLTGSGAILRGATVDGPNALGSLSGLGAPDGFRPCPGAGRDPFRSLTGHATGYLDDVRSSATSEPSGDYAALALMAAAQQAGTG
jgi:endoglucanase